MVLAMAEVLAQLEAGVAASATQASMVVVGDCALLHSSVYGTMAWFVGLYTRIHAHIMNYLFLFSCSRLLVDVFVVTPMRWYKKTNQ